MKALTRRAPIGGVAMLPLPSFAQRRLHRKRSCTLSGHATGRRLRSPFWVRFGLRNMGVTRAGDRALNVGHHHLLVDADTALDPKEPVSSAPDRVHRGTEKFGKARPVCYAQDF